MSLVTIKPKAGSRKFATEGSMRTTNQITTEDGKIINSRVSEFTGERFPKSMQFFRVHWSSLKRKWILEGLDGKEMNKNTEELNALVAETRLQYPSDSKQRDEYIKSADIFDPVDKFFNHKLAYIKASEGEVLVDKSRPLENIILRGLRKHPQFQVAGEVNPLTSAGTRYIIVDKDIDTNIRKELRNKKLEASKYFEALTDEKKIKIAMAMGLVPNESINIDVIDDLLFKACEDLTKAGDTGLTKQDLFISFAKMKTEDLNIKHRIAKAKSLGILKRQGDKGWLLFGSPVGRTQEQIENFLTDPEHQDMLIRLEDALKNDKSN